MTLISLYGVPMARDMATRFMGCTGPDDPVWPACWDLTRHLFIPFPFEQPSAPLAYTGECAHSPHSEVRALADGAGIDDAVQPYFVIDGPALSSHQRLRVLRAVMDEIRIHAAVSLWDTGWDIVSPVIIG